MAELPPLAGWPSQTSLVHLPKKTHKKGRIYSRRSAHKRKKRWKNFLRRLFPELCL